MNIVIHGVCQRDNLNAVKVITGFKSIDHESLEDHDSQTDVSIDLKTRGLDVVLHRLGYVLVPSCNVACRTLIHCLRLTQDFDALNKSRLTRFQVVQ